MKLNFQHDGHFYVNCLIYILIFYCKCFLFEFLGCGIHGHIPIVTGVQKRTQWLKNGHILLKNGLLQLHFQHEDDVDVIFLIYILTIYREFLFCQFFNRGTPAHIPILIRIQKGRINCRKNSHYFAKKCSFWSCFFEMKVTFYVNCYLL